MEFKGQRCHRRCYWLWRCRVCQPKDRISILRLPHIPIKTRKAFFSPQNVCYKCNITELKETDGEGKISCGFADQCYQCSHCQRRPPQHHQNQITSINTPSQFCSCSISNLRSRLKPKHWNVLMGLRHAEMSYPPIYLPQPYCQSL